MSEKKKQTIRDKVNNHHTNNRRNKPEEKSIKSTNRVYRRYKENGKYRTHVYDRKEYDIYEDSLKTENPLPKPVFLRDIPFTQARSEFKFIQMNKKINEIMTKHNVGIQKGRDIYFQNKALIREGRIKGIMVHEKLNREKAIEFYNGLVVSGNYGKLKSYSTV